MKEVLKFFCAFFFYVYFPSSTLCTEEVTMFLNTQTLFWACSTSKPEGYRGMLLKNVWEKVEKKQLKWFKNGLNIIIVPKY